MRSKQKTLQYASTIFVGGALCAALWVSCIGWARDASAADGSPQTHPARTPSSTLTLGDQVATLRLIGEAGLTNGRYRAGIDIAMQPGAHTYWKQPGDAGVPPVFSFNGSQNVASAEVVFPTPARIDESGLEAFGYRDRVVFPVLVTPVDAGKPAILKLDMTYAVCRQLCIPAHNAATMILTPGGRGIDGGDVVSASNRAPTPITAAERQRLSIKPIKGASKPSWTLVWSGTEPVEDIFADAPEGFYFETKKLAADTFRLTATQTVTAAKHTSVPVSLTLARKAHSLVATDTFDIDGSTY